MARKPAIDTPPLGDYYKPIMRLRENVDMLTGRVGGELPVLSSSATTAQIIAAINLIIQRLNASTN